MVTYGFYRFVDEPNLCTENELHKTKIFVSQKCSTPLPGASRCHQLSPLSMQ